MNCDVCGEEIAGKPLKVLIEGAKVIACEDCSHLGELIAQVDVQQVTRPPARFREARPSPTRKLIRRPPARMSKTDASQLEVVEEFPGIVRKAREKLGLTQEELAKGMNERVTVIQRIETGKMVPNLRLARMLEHFLRIKLLTSIDTTEAISLKEKPSTEVTLGDIVQIKKRNPSK